jgi:excisionase family DNA binding protein
MRLNPLTIPPNPPLAWATLVHGYTRAKPHEPSSDSKVVPTVLTIQEACAALRISKWTLYQLIRSRQLVTIKIGSRRVVPLAAIQALIERLQAEEEA